MSDQQRSGYSLSYDPTRPDCPVVFKILRDDGQEFILLLREEVILALIEDLRESIRFLNRLDGEEPTLRRVK